MRTLGVLLVVGILVSPVAAAGPASAATPTELQAFAAASCPAPLPTVLSARPDPTALANARNGDFAVYGPNLIHLVPPIDWHLDPFNSETFRQNLEKLRYLDPLLASYTQHGNVGDLRQALAIGLDWIQGNPQFTKSTPYKAWGAKVVGDRVPFLGYLGRAAECAGILTHSEEQTIIDSMDEHAAFLVDPANHPPDNHGLFDDIGLAQFTDLYPFLGPSGQWRTLAHDRFTQTLTDRLSQGVWLEHSTAYQFLVIFAVQSFLAAYGPDANLSSLLSGMKSSALWFVEPDGGPSQFGDSDLDPVPSWVTAKLPSINGMKVFPGAGFAFINVQGGRGQRGYLAITAGFHNITHKHADDLSFDLYDRGQRIVTDTGDYDKDPSPERTFVESAQAHSTLTVDGATFPISDPNAAYGSGIQAWGKGSGWYAIQATNPMLNAQGVTDTRTYLYRPNQALIVVDSVSASATHTYTRYVQLGPTITTQNTSKGIALQPFSGMIRDTGVSSTVASVRGSLNPFGGLTSPSFRTWVPRTTLSYADVGTSRVSATSISLGSNSLTASSVRNAGGALVVALSDKTGPVGVLHVVQQGQALSVG